MTVEDEHKLQKEISLGKSYMKTRQYDRAEDLFLKILKKHRLADVYNLLGLVYSDLGKFNFAEVAFGKALEINANYMEAALNLAVLYNNLGERKKSKAIYERLKKYGAAGRGGMDPLLMAKLANMHAEIGGLYHSVGEYKRALREYEMAVDLCPNFVDVQTRLAICCREMGEAKKALRIFLNNKPRASKYAPFWIGLGVTYYSLGKSKEALQAWKRALNIEPRNKLAQAYKRLVA
jgi:tetratricopeptide (TPR) repeat protein